MPFEPGAMDVAASEVAQSETGFRFKGTLLGLVPQPSLSHATRLGRGGESGTDHRSWYDAAP
jgi:hypothetical protein